MNMNMKKWVATILIAVMLLSVVPVTTKAADSAYIGGTKIENGLGLTKTAVLQPDGTYTITLEAFATGETVTSMSTEGVPMDIALVIDQSASMMDPIDQTQYAANAANQESGKVPGFFVKQGSYSSAGGYYFTHAVIYDSETQTWYYDEDTQDTELTWVELPAGTVLYKSRLGALTEALNSFVNVVLQDTHAYDKPVDHRIALIGYAYGSADSNGSYGIISPGSGTNYAEDGFVNTGLYVDGVLQNYGYYIGEEDYAPQTHLPHAFLYNEKYYLASYCDTCQGWFNSHTSHSSYSSNYGTKVTPKSSASASGYQFYDIIGQVPDTYQAGLVSVNDGSNNLAASISKAISNIGAFGGTNVGYGIELAKNVFHFNPIPEGETRKRVVVVFSDGACDADNISMAVGSAAELKTDPYNATVFTVGLYGSGEETTDIKNFMAAISSTYPDASYSSGSINLGTPGYFRRVYDLDLNSQYYVVVPIDGEDRLLLTQYSTSYGKWYVSYGGKNYTYTPMISPEDTEGFQVYEPYPLYMTASNTEALKTIFSSIVTEATNYTPNVELNADSILKDVLNPDLFKLGAGYGVTVQTQGMTTSDGITYSTKGSPKAFAADVTVDAETNTIEVTGFDYSTKFISKNHDGEKLIVTITGVVGLDAAATGKPEFTNDVAVSGIYHSGLPVSLFPEPTGLIPCKSYVLDYAKSFDVTAAALGLTSILDVGTTMDKIDNAFSGVDLPYGSVAKNGSDLRYTPETTNWDGYDSFYVFGQKSDSTYEWVKVSVLPANNVYFEDDFVTTADGKTVGIEYNGDWTVDGTASGNTEDPNGPIHGWEAGLSGDTGYSDGAAHMTAASGAMATFTFTGTGVDVYSRTNMETGLIIAVVTKDGETIANMALMVDNLAASGDYYQIPTLSIHTIYDSETGTEVKMPYGTYTVTLYVSDAYTLDAEGNVVPDENGDPKKRSTYYLDGIRVYNPLETDNDTIISGAYGEEELNATFTEIRDLLLDAGSFGPTSSAGNTATLVTDASTLKVGDRIIIVAAEDDVALSTTQKDNNRGQATITKDGNTITFGDDAQIITLENGAVATTFAFNVGTGYLYAASSSANYLRTESVLTNNSSWVITIDPATGAASIVSQGSYERNTIRYNQSSDLFACYAPENSQKDICIYKIENTEAEGVVFIDQLEDKTTGQITSDVGVYEDYGPKNEVYLKPGQSIVFRVSGNAANYYYVGLKSIEAGKTVTVEYSGSAGEQTIGHTTDLYYKLTPDSEGYVVIQNVSGGILAVTKLRTTGASANGLILYAMSQSEARMVQNAFKNNLVQKPIEYVWLDNMVVELFKSLNTWFE